jgi:hypothetical protein
MDVRGLPLRALFDLSERARVSADVEAAMAEPALLILDVMSPAPRFGRPEAEGLRTQIAVLPMTDADLAPTRALYVMGAVEGEVAQNRRAASLVHDEHAQAAIARRRACAVGPARVDPAPGGHDTGPRRSGHRSARARWPARGFR